MSISVNCRVFNDGGLELPANTSSFRVNLRDVWTNQGLQEDLDAKIVDKLQLPTDHFSMALEGEIDGVARECIIRTHRCNDSSHCFPHNFTVRYGVHPRGEGMIQHSFDDSTTVQDMLIAIDPTGSFEGAEFAFNREWWSASDLLYLPSLDQRISKFTRDMLQKASFKQNESILNASQRTLDSFK